MSNSKIIPYLAVSALWLLLGGYFIFMQPGVALAQSPISNSASVEKCADCHDDETKAWENSPHAKTATGGTCESCHGPYTEGHPEDGIMQLGVDSASCQKCHTETYEQWEYSSHGQANVQCISCHLSHSQEFRLTDEALCETCHRDQLNDFAHSTHNGAELTCTDCHLSMASRNLTGSAGLTEVTGGGDPPNHNFIVTSQTCIDCHERAPAKSAFHTPEPQPTEDAQMAEMAARLKTAEQTNLSLKGMSVGGVGAGLGIGGMLGIAFVFIAGWLHQRRM